MRMPISLMLLLIGMLSLALIAGGCGKKETADTEDQTAQSEAATDGPVTPTTLVVEGMTCAGCVTSVRSALKQVPGVQRADVDLEKGEAVVHFTKARIDDSALVEAIAKIGYTASAKPPTQN